MGNFPILAIQLRKRFDMIAGERYRNHQELAMSPTPKSSNHLRGAGPEPTNRPDVGLVGQQIGVRKRQMLNDRLNAGADLLWIRIAAIDHVQRQRVSAEE
jgi:hypothetical protein